GILDGIDGKLARLTLRFSKSGALLDHVTDTVYDGLWCLTLGWYFSQGDLNSIAAQFTFIFFTSYVVERIVPGIFKKLHGYEIYDYEDIDKVMRLIGSRRNNNIWLLMIGIILGVARETYYFISIWMLVTASWHTLRLIWVTWISKVKKPALVSKTTI
ncbi:MAG: CDP-alcohol phosphatidyltransferase family protein, partial [bacterium]